MESWRQELAGLPGPHSLLPPLSLSLTLSPSLCLLYCLAAHVCCGMPQCNVACHPCRSMQINQMATNKQASFNYLKWQRETDKLMHCHIDSTGFAAPNCDCGCLRWMSSCSIEATLLCSVFIDWLCGCVSASVCVCASVSRYQSHRQVPLALAP